MSKVNTLEEKFCDVDGSTELLADICLDKKNQNIKSVVIDDKFLIANSNNNLFISAFAYTLSCFTGDKDCVFLLVENNAKKLVQYPFKSNCQFKDNDEFLKQNGDYYDHIKGVDTSEISQILTKLNFEGASAIGIEDLAQSGNKQCQYKLDDHSLLLKVLNQNNRIELQLEYANSYSDKTMTNFLYSYQRFLEALCNNDDITQVSYITDEDLEFLNKFNRTQTKLQYTDVLEAYNYNIKNKPDNICVCCKDKKITYAQSSLLVAKLAEELKSNGVDIDTKVAIYVPRSI